MDGLLNDIKTFFTNAGLNILIGIAIIVLGLLACKFIKVIIRKLMRRSKRDEAVTSFVVSLTDIVLKVIIMISALATMGINTASLIAVLGTCGVAIGLALKDSLGNLASGIIIIFNKPFKKGDYIDVGEVSGTIESINLFNTTLSTFDGKKVILPNSSAVNNPIINYDGYGMRRADIPISVEKGTDLETIKRLVGEIVEKDTRVSEAQPFTVRMSAQTENSIEMVLKVWTDDSLYWDVLYDLTERIYTVFTENGILKPSQKVDVSFKPGKNAAGAVGIDCE